MHWDSWNPQPVTPEYYKLGNPNGSSPQISRKRLGYKKPRGKTGVLKIPKRSLANDNKWEDVALLALWYNRKRKKKISQWFIRSQITQRRVT